ncbi:MAG TPA: hypothetical protein VGF28_06205 [Thermoanaerobaculia bacterium]|jgi:hypothetical protein
MTSVPTVSDRQADARAAFVQWASLQPGAPRDAGSLVQDVTVSYEYAGFLSTDVEGRRVVWRAVPAGSRARITVPEIALETVDAWSAEARPLRAGSEHVAICDACGGERKTRCGSCGGSGTARCHTCGGQRKMYGYASNGAYRLLNCTACRGKGEVDCSHCRRGIATCAACGGEGRVQRWLELETWRRSTARLHPQSLALRFGWSEDPSNETLTRDAEVTVDVERPRRLMAAELGKVPPQWLELLSPPLQPGERVARQRLRIARVATTTVHYRLGSGLHQAEFTGRRFVAPPEAANGFARRAARLRTLLFVLLTVGCIVAAASLARGAFYWSGWTFASLGAFAAGLAAAYAAAADATGAGRPLRGWLPAAGLSLLVAIFLAIAGMPRAAHAERLIAAGQLHRAELELDALGTGAEPRAWADLRVARIRQAADLDAARALLAKIPRELPQHSGAAAMVDRLILRAAQSDVDAQRWSAAASKLALLSGAARGQPESVAVARAAYLPLVSHRLARTAWSSAADAMVEARGAGVPPADLQSLAATFRTAASEAAAEAGRERDPRRRLRLRLAAEEILVAAERAAGAWGTPPLIALRTALAKDVAAVERAERRRGSR